MTTKTETYTDADIRKGAIFLARMMPYIAQGMTSEDAGKAVLARDEELFDIVSQRVHARSEQGEMISSTLAAQVYAEIRTQAHTTTNLDEYGKRALATRIRRAPAARLARIALKAAIQRSKALGQAARQAQNTQERT